MPRQTYAFRRFAVALDTEPDAEPVTASGEEAGEREEKGPTVAHSDVDVINPPRRRIGAVVLIRHGSRVLMVKPSYKDGWQLPGGGAHTGEAVADAAARELREETGLIRRFTHFLALDQVPMNTETGVAEGYNVVCDGGMATDEEVFSVDVPLDARHEIVAVKWIELAELASHAKPYQVRRVRYAHAASTMAVSLPLLWHGQRVT